MQPDIKLNVSVDCVVLGFDLSILNVLLVDRNFTKDGIVYADLKLPGDLVKPQEDLEDSARRILIEQMGLSNIYMKQFMSFGSPDRLKRKELDLVWLRQKGYQEEHIITVAYYSLIDLSKLSNKRIRIKDDVKLCPVLELTDLAMDHMEILKSALEYLRLELLSKPLAFELLPEKFTLSQMQKLYEIILGKIFDKRNFRKKFANMKYLIPLNEKQVGVAHSPARLYMFSPDLYTRTMEED
jgi:8-oxo-dGTP diphosphatase